MGNSFDKLSGGVGGVVAGGRGRAGGTTITTAAAVLDVAAGAGVAASR